MTTNGFTLRSILSRFAACIACVVCAQAQTWTVREYGDPDPNNAWTSEDGPATHESWSNAQYRIT